MNYQTFTNDSLTMMYEAIRGALAADDALKRQSLAIPFRVRETPKPPRAGVGENYPICVGVSCM
jgi:hypothetical protein